MDRRTAMRNKRKIAGGLFVAAVACFASALLGKSFEVVPAGVVLLIAGIISAIINSGDED
jgi:CHASE2 domain-containing sensor protein